MYEFMLAARSEIRAKASARSTVAPGVDEQPRGPNIGHAGQALVRRHGASDARVAARVVLVAAVMTVLSRSVFKEH
jgi:hypothetical protein